MAFVKQLFFSESISCQFTNVTRQGTTFNVYFSEACYDTFRKAFGRSIPTLPKGVCNVHANDRLSAYALGLRGIELRYFIFISVYTVLHITI